MNDSKLYPYTLVRNEGHASGSTLIEATHDDAAFEHLGEILGIALEQGRPTEEAFLKAGGKAFFRGLRQIFPPAPEFSNHRIIVSKFDPSGGYKAHIDGSPGYWGIGSSKYEAVGDLVMNHGDKIRVVVI